MMKGPPPPIRGVLRAVSRYRICRSTSNPRVPLCLFCAVVIGVGLVTPVALFSTAVSQTSGTLGGVRMGGVFPKTARFAQFQTGSGHVRRSSLLLRATDSNGSQPAVGDDGGQGSPTRSLSEQQVAHRFQQRQEKLQSSSPTRSRSEQQVAHRFQQRQGIQQSPPTTHPRKTAIIITNTLT
ncbi:uncharacterized protein LOC143286368 [Babylonia areolata]|uniref:uncharacterized protein LOC143286368 n=1 Tax=Babylonia areolata TaxID=304850 RepID=UPI003FCEF25E